MASTSPPWWLTWATRLTYLGILVVALLIGAEALDVWT